MPVKLKNIFFTKDFVNNLGDSIQSEYAKFDKNQFNKLVFDKEWKKKELKEKMRHITLGLHKTLHADYPKALEILKKVAPSYKSFDAMVFPDFVECYGLEYWDISMSALRLFTKSCSSEFAIRPFLVKDPNKAIKQIMKWAGDKDHHVRRLASEGCRPRLPWAIALPKFKIDPSPIIPILDKLKNDESEYVRRSVANNLNDISKDHPGLVLDICEKWYNENRNTDWIVKHACRTMLKSGNKQAMRLFGFGNPKLVNIENFNLNKKSISIGDTLYFSFNLNIETKKAIKLRLEYIVYYKKSNGDSSRKVFQIKEKTFKPGSYNISRKLSFEDLSTRKHYPGEYKISIIVNGVEKSNKTFKLTDSKK